MSTALTTPAKAHEAASPPELPEVVAAHPLLEESAWVAMRDSGISPCVATEMVTTAQARREFLVGAWLLDASVKNGGLLANIKPQMLQVVDVLAAGRFKNGVIEPRRSSKTTSLWCVLLGRCYLNEMHFAGYTMATTAKKTTERYRIDVYSPITRRWPDEDTRPVKVYKSNGSERVEFTNGSLLSILSPDADAFTSGAYDTILVDEGGKATPEMGVDIETAVLPTFDTRPEGQYIVAGTAGEYREGNMLWEVLENPDAGILRYTVTDTVTDEEMAAWEPSEDHPYARVRELIEGMHPGLSSGLTTLEKIRENFKSFGVEQFAREYLGVFGLVGVKSGIFDLTKWAAAGRGAALPTLPERFGLAMVCHPDQLSASLLAAWRDEDGKAVPLLLDHKSGVEWLAPAALRASRKYSMPLVHDSGSQVVLLTVETLNRAKPRPKLHPMTFMDVKKGAALVVDEVDRENVVHYRQPELDDAIKLAVKRKAGVNGWALGRDPKSSNDDITPAEAFSLALLAYDNQKPAGGLVMKVRT